MKIWCDVCSRKEASVFCSADEASLCLDCDPKVHQANKLASKHQRFSLVKPTSSSFPICDICQEKKALLFCQQDRAILCRDCDVSIHAVNEHTQKHNRYLLTGIKLSPSTITTSNLPESTATASSCTTTRLSKSTTHNSDNSGEGFDQVPDFKSQSEITSTVANCNHKKTQQPAAANSMSSKDVGSGVQLINNNSGGGVNNSDGSGSTSTLSQYLIEMLPGWQVEDLLQDSSSLPFGYTSKMLDNNNFLGTDLLSSRADDDSSSFENMGLWVPQAPPPPLPHLPQQSLPFSSSSNIAFGMNNHHGLQNHHHQARGEITSTMYNKKQSNRKKMIDNPYDGFMVPQISPQFLSGNNKRSRPFC